MGRGFNLRDRIRHRDPKPHPVEQRQVDQFVAYCRHFRQIQVQGRQEFFQNGYLVPDPFIEAADLQFAGPVKGGVGAAAAYQGYFDAPPAGHFDAVAVPDVKDLEGLPFGIEIEAAVGENAVDVQDEQAYAAGAAPDVFRV
jgi:hypothetical protein